MYADWGGGGRCNSYLLQLCTQVAAVTVVYRQCGTRDPGDTGNSSCTFVAFVPPSPFLPSLPVWPSLPRHRRAVCVTFRPCLGPTHTA